MKHQSRAALARHAAAPPAVQLSEDQVKEKLRAQLDGTEGAKLGLALRMGVSVGQLSKILRNQAGVNDTVAERMGLRRVVVFEPISS